MSGSKGLTRTSFIPAARQRAPGVPLAEFRRWCALVAPHLHGDHPQAASVLDTVVSGLHSSIGLDATPLERITGIFRVVNSQDRWDKCVVGARLAAAMEADPDAGIIQTLPLIINRKGLGTKNEVQTLVGYPFHPTNANVTATIDGKTYQIIDMPVVEPAALLQPALLQEETITDENSGD